MLLSKTCKKRPEHLYHLHGQYSQITGFVVNYGIPNTIVLEIPSFTTKPAKWHLFIFHASFPTDLDCKPMRNAYHTLNNQKCFMKIWTWDFPSKMPVTSLIAINPLFPPGPRRILYSCRRLSRGPKFTINVCVYRWKLVWITDRSNLKPWVSYSARARPSEAPSWIIPAQAEARATKVREQR